MNGGLIADREFFVPVLILMFCWATIMYSHVVYWIWGGKWASQWRGDALDYARGGTVQVLSSASVFFYSAFLGKRSPT